MSKRRSLGFGSSHRFGQWYTILLLSGLCSGAAAAWSLGFFPSRNLKSPDRSALSDSRSPDRPALPDPRKNLATSVFRQLSERGEACISVDDMEELVRIIEEAPAEFLSKCQKVFRMDAESVKKVYIMVMDELIEVFQDKNVLNELSKANSFKDIDCIVERMENQYAACWLKEICATYLYIYKNDKYHNPTVGFHPIFFKLKTLEQDFSGWPYYNKKLTSQTFEELSTHCNKRMQDMVEWHDRCKVALEPSTPFYSRMPVDRQATRIVQTGVLSTLLVRGSRG